MRGLPQGAGAAGAAFFAPPPNFFPAPFVDGTFPGAILARASAILSPGAALGTLMTGGP